MLDIMSRMRANEGLMSGLVFCHESHFTHVCDLPGHIAECCIIYPSVECLPEFLTYRIS